MLERTTPPRSSISRTSAFASISLPPTGSAMPPPISAISVSGTQKPPLAPSGVRPRCITQGATIAWNTSLLKRPSSTSRAVVKKSAAKSV